MLILIRDNTGEVIAVIFCKGNPPPVISRRGVSYV